MTKITLNSSDIREISKVLDEFDITSFKLIHSNESSIGYNLDLEYTKEINGKMVTIRVPIANQDKW